MSTDLLADTSAWNRTGATPELVARWTEFIVSGRVALCPPVRLEILVSARGGTEYSKLTDELQALPSFALGRREVDRASEVQALLAQRSQHRGPTPTDLFIAAIAEANGVTLVHYDRHFDAIARVTGQQTAWIAPRGTLD